MDSSTGLSGQNWVRVADADQIQEGAPISVVFEGAEVGLFRVGEAVFAISNICTHGLARLSDGYQEGFTIECPLHQGLFDVRNGACMAPPVEVDVTSYEVRLENGAVLLGATEKKA